MDRIKCKNCGGESYNESGKTNLVCGKCFEQLEAKVKRLEEEVARLENAKLKIGEIVLGDEILRIEHAGETPNGLQILVSKP